MADGGIGNQSPATLFQARLDTSNGVSNTLTLRQYIGNKVVVAGLTVAISSAGLTRDVADNLIDAAGADAGAAGAANTLYYVYVSNQKASFSPSSIRLSATAPSLVNGVKYLGAAGNALNWRFVGWVWLNATPNFESTPKNHLIVNYYNRLRTSIYAPASGDFTTTSGAYGQVDPAGSLTVGFISNGEDSISLAGDGAASESGLCVIAVAIGIDSTTVPSIIGCNGRGGVGIQTTVIAEKSVDLSEGFHFATLLFTVSGGNTLNLSALDPVGGSGAQATFMDGNIFV